MLTKAHKDTDTAADTDTNARKPRGLLTTQLAYLRFGSILIQVPKMGRLKWVNTLYSSRFVFKDLLPNN